MAQAPTNFIKQINTGTLTHDIAAMYIVDGNNFHDWNDITELVSTSFRMIVSTNAANTPKGVTFGNITGTLEADNADHSAIYFVQGGISGSYVEYIAVKTSSELSPAYTWEQIGTTDLDLEGYAKTGDYTGSATISYDKSSNQTGASGAVTINGSSFGFSGTAATHNHSVTAAGTIGVGNGTSNFTPSGSISITPVAAETDTVNNVTDAALSTTPTFTGTTETLSHTVTPSELTSTGSFTPYGTITGSQSVSSHTHTIGSSTTTVKTVKDWDAGSATIQSSVITGATIAATVMTEATVTNGVLAFTTATQSVTPGTQSYTAPSLTTDTPTVVASIDANSGSAGAVTINGNSFGFSGTAGTVTVTGTPEIEVSEHTYTPHGTISKPSITLTKTTKTFAVSGISSASAEFTGDGVELTFTGSSVNTSSATLTPSGTITGSQSVSSHTHGITLTSTAVTGTAVININ